MATLRIPARAFAVFSLIIREIYFTGVLVSSSSWYRACSSAWCSACRAMIPWALWFGRHSVCSLVACRWCAKLGPVVSALLFASRAGSAITAEIGLMKATEQLSAMEMMAVDPIARVVAPRFWAGVISMPLLAAMFSAMGVFGGYLVGVVLIGVDEGSFWSQMQSGGRFPRGHHQRGDQELRLWRCRHRDRVVRGL